jgi:2',3'-cyclic-nucleotide 2'-phosphodiesterase (5'-nucleotidase family)
MIQKLKNPLKMFSRNNYAMKYLLPITIVILLLFPAIIFFTGTHELFKSTEPNRERHAVLLAVNDIYRLKGVGAEEAGGLHRLRSLRALLERGHPDLILLHAGDFLAPSLLSRIYYGEQMVDVMNWLDGAVGAFDERMLVTFGNHEFDDTRCGDGPKPLLARVAESEFLWLTANLDFSQCDGLKTIFEAPKGAPKKVQPMTVIESGGIRIGVFGLSLTPDGVSGGRFPILEHELDTTRRTVKALREERGAEFVVALTHLPIDQDLALLKNTKALGPDLIVGGHDHDNMRFKENGRWVFKADSDARTAWRIDVRIAEDGTRSVDGTLMKLDKAMAPDVAITEVADGWFARHQIDFCTDPKRKLRPGCLDDIYGKTQTPIEAEEMANRNRETGLGNWAADQMRLKSNADVALINSGGLRLNENLEKGSDITRRQMESLIQYDSVIVKLDVAPQTLWAAVEHGLEGRGSGAWAHLSGLRVKVAEDGGLDALWLKQNEAWESLEPDSDAPVKLASVPFVFCGGDAFPFKEKLDDEDSGACQKRLSRAAKAGGQASTLKELLVQAIEAAEPAGIAPEKDGRICEANQSRCAWTGETNGSQ